MFLIVVKKANFMTIFFGSFNEEGKAQNEFNTFLQSKEFCYKMPELSTIWHHF
jgi:hypothetical protein